MRDPSNTPEEMIPGNPKATRLRGQVIVVVLELTEPDWNEYPLPRVVRLSGALAAPVLPMLANGLTDSSGKPGLGEPLKRLGFIGLMDLGNGPFMVELDPQQADAISSNAHLRPYTP